MQTSKTKLKTGELAFIHIKFVDENGNIVPYIEQQVDLQFIGESVYLQGFGSAQVKTDETYNNPYHNSFRGSLLAAVRAGTIKGQTRILIKTKNHITQEIMMEVE